MTTTPTSTGKIKGSFRDVTPKLRNFVGAVKVTTPKGKGGILMEMGKPVAAYITQDGVLHKGKESLGLLDAEPLAEFEVIRYDDEQFKEAMAICDNRGLLTGVERAAPAIAPSPARETKIQEERPREGKLREEKLGEEKPRGEEKNLLSAMMKRFTSPRPAEKKEITREAPKQEPVKAPLPAVSAPRAEPPATGLPVPRPPEATGKPLSHPEKKEAAAASPAPSGETDLSAIIRRLREASKAEKATSPGGKAEEAPAKPPAPLPAESVVPAATASPVVKVEGAPAAAPPAGKASGVPGGGEANGRVKVDLGQMMKRIKRLDITSIRKELEERTEGVAPSAGGGESPAPASPAGGTAPEAKAAAPAPVTEGKSDIDELKAFIKKLEVLEEPKEEPLSKKGLLGRLGAKVPGGEAGTTAPRRDIPAPVPRKEISFQEPAAGEVRPARVEKPLEKTPAERPPAERPPVEKPVAGREVSRPAEPDRRAKIASLLRRSGLVRPPVEEQPKEIIVSPKEPKVAVERGAPAPAPGLAPDMAEEPEIRVPKPQRKKVEITLVPKKPEKPLREPPLIDEKALQKVLRQPGVIAVSTFFEGFAVQSVGRADFEQVAANAEDLFRAGKKIAREIDIGPLNQILLETGKGKLIIAPHGDLNIAVFTGPDANLGLIRMAIKGLQVEKD
jgi:predicted regulator of Ras-like GTPase activity (Roadblock/LC7/MglB family)